jgi:hypothetical protein
MWQHLTEIFSYLGLETAAAQFPPMKQRGRSWKKDSPEIKAGLLAMYGDLYERINKQPDIECL